MIYGLLQYGAISQKKFTPDGGGQWRNGREKLEKNEGEKNKQLILRACGDISRILKTERIEMNKMGEGRRGCWASKGREEMESN